MAATVRMIPPITADKTMIKGRLSENIYTYYVIIYRNSVNLLKDNIDIIVYFELTFRL